MKDLYSNIYTLEKLGKLDFKVTKSVVKYSNELYSNEEHSFIFFIGDIKYQVGWFIKNKIDQVNESWGKTESSSGDIFIKNDKNVESSEIEEDIKNYTNIERDNKLKKLLND